AQIRERRAAFDLRSRIATDDREVSGRRGSCLQQAGAMSDRRVGRRERAGRQGLGGEDGGESGKGRAREYPTFGYRGAGRFLCGDDQEEAEQSRRQKAAGAGRYVRVPAAIVSAG